MQQAIHSRNTKHKSSGGRTRVRSGCITCKKRKVKCDEGRPACRRCISAGRVCAGYGIWGGGGGPHGNAQPSSLVAFDTQSTPSPVAVSVFVASSEDKTCFDWFMRRALTKMSGSFCSSFWNTLLIQVCHSEPAVFHAVLALSSVHKGGVANNLDWPVALREQEQLATQHYIKAIRHLQPHFATKDMTSFRIALITCVVFVALELLRGHFQAALFHLQNGLKVLRTAQQDLHLDGELRQFDPSRNLTDQWIVEILSRLQFQMELFKLSYQGPCLSQSDEPELLGGGIPHLSVTATWQLLQHLMNRIFNLARKSYEIAPGSASLAHSKLFQDQQQIRAKLNQWLSIFQSLTRSRQGPFSYSHDKAYKLMPIYHSVANIMNEVCLHPDDESAFDSQTTQFVFLLSQLAEIWTFGESEVSQRLTPKHCPGHFVDMAQSGIDVGWIPPLFYIATKCRVHRIRLQAIRLLEQSSHREGIWDGEIMACICRKVVWMEEGDFYQNAGIMDDFPLSGCPTPADLALPLIPDSYRLRGLDVTLSGEPVDKIILSYKKYQDGSSDKAWISEYDVGTQRWIDKT